MMKTILLCASILILSCNNGTKIASTKTINRIQIAIEKNGNSLLSDPKINAISIGVYKDGKIYTRHFGELDKGKKNVPSDSTIYEIASVSKSFTGTLVAQAVLDKKLDLEDDIRKFLKGNYSNLEYKGNPIKVKHLITHTAGLPRFFPTRINDLFNNIDENLPFRIYDIEKDYNKVKFLNDLESISINIIPGTSYAYSNADVELMAHILENVYQTSFEQLLQKYICEKADMKNTKVHLSPTEVKHLANGYGEINNPVPHFANTLWGAGGGLKSTTSDLVNYMKFQFENNNQVVAESHKLIYSDENIEMAYLWPISNDSEDGTYYNIHGGAFGTQNFLIILPKYDLGISIITNQSGPETQGKLWNTLSTLLSEIKNNS
ncbi:serine hydrolase domain-containing protein [Spongiivirga sp. MCCC 1A20706]|uniref:serine hydrolase domain-containing protein n=1 Tax=Spongiivirga sp. MCCC 1A20706 TaxID=3160963 RepID=UPI0039779F8D